MRDNIDFVDESGDREHFTIIPNYIANHSTAVDQALYFQIKKHAGEKGECFASEKTLMKKMGIGWKTLKKSLKYLIDHNWIYLKGHRWVNTAGGEQFIKVYGVNNIWKLNSDFYDKGVSKREPLAESSERGLSKNTKGSLKDNLIRTRIKNQEEEVLSEEQIREQKQLLKECRDTAFRAKFVILPKN